MFKVRIQISGLIAYAIQEKEQKIDALILASRDMPHGGHAGNHEHEHAHDIHVPLLILPIGAVKKEVGSAASDYVFEAGTDEYGAWRLEDTIVHVRPDGKPPRGKVIFSTAPGGEIPTYADEGSLHWVPKVSKAADMECTFRDDCLPPDLNAELVTGAVRMADGAAAAMWSSIDARTEVFTFEKPKGSTLEMKDYIQALADGLEWTLFAEKFVEIQLQHAREGTTRSIFVKLECLGITIQITNKSATVDGTPVFEDSRLASHFGMFYDIVEPPPGAMARRLPRRKGTLTKANRCPGAS